MVGMSRGRYVNVKNCIPVWGDVLPFENTKLNIYVLSLIHF